MAEGGEIMYHGGMRESCKLCGAFENLQRCASCKRVYYCSKEHQKRHWRIHKKSCHAANTQMNMSSFSNVVGNTISMPLQHRHKITSVFGSSPVSNTNAYIVNNRTESDSTSKQISNVQQSSINQPSTNNNDRMKQTLSNIGQNNQSSYATKDVVQKSRPEPNLFSELRPKFKMHSKLAEEIMANNERMHNMSEQIIRDLKEFGICVLDHFLGEELGNAILEEVKAMYNSGVFQDGAVVKNRSKDSASIRGDKISWITETDEKCQHITDLIGIIDRLIAHCIKKPNNGVFDKYEITDRTKAMVACYPGDGAHYVKHVDNPNNDGRCITSIYYLNKDWTEACGGILRIFPEGNDQVADIIPIFDRMLFFWSDRRNPHEVQSSYETRYAITVWYLDKKERDQAQPNGKNGMGNIRIS